MSEKYLNLLRQNRVFLSNFNPITPVQPSAQKYSSSIFPKFMFLSAHPASLEGRLAIVTDVGGRMRWT